MYMCAYMICICCMYENVSYIVSVWYVYVCMLTCMYLYVCINMCVHVCVHVAST